mmetsp:Transcript_6684/g.17487  ORF Transcript_6684/g.17487 Transcript_6684/m.17487 type:complete len:216 (+) Transcript_6684:65-712(+)
MAWRAVGVLAVLAAVSQGLVVAPGIQQPRPATLRRVATIADAQATSTLKDDLLDLCDRAKMGRETSLRDAVRSKIEELEDQNPTPKPVESDLLMGCWRLVYTTSESILGVERLRPLRPRPKILQSINTATLVAKNEEWVLMGLVRNLVRADLTPRDDGRTVDVQFKRFGIGWLRIPAPPTARGVLETTYLDDDLRISRGDKGNLFVLVKDGPTRI